MGTMELGICRIVGANKSESFSIATSRRQRVDLVGNEITCLNAWPVEEERHVSTFLKIREHV